jgi:drug/metabolite transporter (DMT)-like permease
MTAVVTLLLLREQPSLPGWIGIALLTAGVLMLSLRGGRELQQLDRRAVAFAFATALTICGYTVTDGVGVRLAGGAAAYALALFVGIGPVIAVYALLRNGGDLLRAGRRDCTAGLAGGALQVTSYTIAVWGMMVAPIALVAALRETSVLFGAIIAVVLLKEPLRITRLAAALTIVCGLALIRLG